MSKRAKWEIRAALQVVKDRVVAARTQAVAVKTSHFLRSIGYKDCAITDLLVRHGLINKPRMLTKKKHLETGKVLK